MSRGHSGLVAFRVVICISPFLFAAPVWAAITVGGDPGEVMPDDPSTWDSSTTGSIGVGRSPGSTGTITVDGNSALLSGTGYIGDGGSGFVTVTGNGSTWTNSRDLYVGNSGTGNLTVVAGGQVNNNSAQYGYGNLMIGYNYGSQGNLIVTSGGKVNSNYGLLGRSDGSQGSVAVTGVNSSWTIKQDLYVGIWGRGNLTIADGGKVIDGNAYLGDQNLYASGQITVTGAGSTWTNNGHLYIGNHGTGNLTIANGGTVSNGNGYLGYYGSGNVTVTGNGSTWTNLDDLFVGYYGTGNLTIADGGKVTCYGGLIGYMGGPSTPAQKVLVTGTGSTWANSQNLIVNGNGILTIADGGQVRNTCGYLGYQNYDSGSALITGNGSTWTNDGPLYVSYGSHTAGNLTIANGGKVVSRGESHLGSAAYAVLTGPGSTWTNHGLLYAYSGNLTIADGGKLEAQSLVVSSMNLRVSGNNMVVLGDDFAAGSIGNAGTINLYANTFLTAGVYRPISEAQGRPITWGGNEPIAFGGTWNSGNKTFFVSAATSLAAGAVGVLTDSERLLIAGSGQQVGASFGPGVAGKTFSANLAPVAQQASLQALLPTNESVLSAWNFTTNLTGNTVLLSFNIGSGASNLKTWHYDGSTWTSYDATDLSFDNDGVASFSVTGFSGYGLTGTLVPEPATLSLLGLGLLALVRRRRHRA